MKHVKALIVIALACVVSACGSDPVRRQAVTVPAVGSIATRGVGEALLESGTGIVVPDLELKEGVTLGKYRFPKGTYEYDEEDSDSISFEGPDEDIYMRKSDGYLCLEDTNTCVSAKYVLKKRLDSVSEDTLQQTLLYNGKIGSKITLGYREFYNDIARPAFSNSADYDLSASKVVGYKGARLKVISATNTEITYKVLSGFSG